jgi:hypothetical protein
MGDDNAAAIYRGEGMTTAIIILSTMAAAAVAFAYLLAKNPPIPDFSISEEIGEETELSADQKAFIASLWDVKR